MSQKFRTGFKRSHLHEIIHLASFLCAFLSFTVRRVMHPPPRHALSSPPTWWTCWGSSRVHGPWLRGRLSEWWASSTASSAQSRPSWSRALVRQSWSWGPASSMPGTHVWLLFLREYCTDNLLKHLSTEPVGLHCGSEKAAPCLF